jgi:hypothetical protein
MALADQYPRIANALVRQWGDAKACRAYFEDLLNDRRGGRKGFPPAVLRDIRRLADYYIRNHIAIGDTFQSRALSREGPQVRSPARLQLVVG